MGSAPHQPVETEAPLYVRWGPERSPFAIELKLDVVPRIAAELDRAEQSGMEIGGVLIGYFTNSATPILRIEECEMISRGPNDGAIYMLDPNQRDRFVQIHRAAAARDRTAVGFFRSHFRPGPMRPSLADRSLLSGELKRPIYALLLIQAQEPHRANFFVATDGQLPSEASVDEFRFAEREFLGLPEVQVETSEVEEAIADDRQPTKTVRNVLAGLLLLAVVVGGAWLLSSRFSVPGSSSQSVNLVITPERGLLRISWNHSAREISKASEAMLVITDGESQREVKLGADELRLGAVDYDRISRHVQVVLNVSNGNTTAPVQTAEWTAQ